MRAAKRCARDNESAATHSLRDLVDSDGLRHKPHRIICELRRLLQRVRHLFILLGSLRFCCETSSVMIAMFWRFAQQAVPLPRPLTRSGGGTVKVDPRTLLPLALVAL